MKKKSDYEKELEEFYDIEDDDYDNPYENCGVDTTIRTPEDLAEVMGNEFQHVINHYKKDTDS
jgi:hypothetical protein